MFQNIKKDGSNFLNIIWIKSSMWTPRCFYLDNLVGSGNGGETDTVHIPAHTAFIAGKQKDDISILFRNEKDC